MSKFIGPVWIAVSVGIAIAASGLYAFYRQGVIRTAEQQATAVNQVVAGMLGDILGSDYRQILRDSTRGAGVQVSSKRLGAQLQRKVGALIRGLGITQVRLIAPNGLILFSAGMAGSRPRGGHDTQLAAARAGRASSVVRFDGRSSLLAHVIPVPVRAVSFLPLRLSVAGPVEGVVEIRSRMTDLAGGIREDQLWLLRAALGMLSAICLAGVMVVLRFRQLAGPQPDSAHAENLGRRLIHQDSLTGLPNRASFSERVRHAVTRDGRKAAMFCIMLIDLDRFKVVNDSLGHEAGDRLLLEAAARICRTVRDGDPVFRMGGDEFAVLMDGLERVEDAARLAQRIIDQIGRTVLLRNHEINPGASIGIAIYPKDGVTAEHLIKDADAAMYRAKESGRNRYEFFTRDMNTRAMERLGLETSLQRAMRNGEFVLFYQPRVLLADGKTAGIEALLRWQHPQSGILAPDKFLSVLEESELIVSVGTWVLRTACAQNAAWQAQGLPPVRVSVNISSRQFRNGSLVDTLRSVLHETGLSPSWLELELTESLLMEDTAAAIDMMRQIKELGVCISLDDFGTGYSSLSYLRQFPVDYLKLDQTFIRDLSVSEKDMAITVAVSNLARSLKMGLVAEGVEESEHLEFLQRHGCQEAQGYLFSRPVPPERIPEMLVHHGQAWIT
ncbi:MAG: EAL domain-containing protein [Gammaproteobacteria bacterium]|nr:EAL domain-containing protein [Gammaproteobacteria bacterium]